MVQPPPAYSAPQPPHSTGSRRSRWITAVAVLVLVAAAAAGGYLVGRHRDSDTAKVSSGAPYGPARMTDGVPGGYTHDQGGAANAAVNAVQASLLVQANKLKANDVIAHLAAPNIDPASKTKLAKMNYGSVTNPSTSLAFPLLVQTDQFNAVTVKETVFFTEIDYGEGNKGSQTGGQQFFFATVKLVWSGRDWKVATLGTRYTAPGPGGLSAINEPDTHRFEPWRGTQFIFLAD